MDGCIACDLIEGRRDLPGGRIYGSEHWVVEHCIGPFPLGTLILKPRRHCLHIWELNDNETAELGPLLKKTTGVASMIVEADQVYCLLWSHMNGQPASTSSKPGLGKSIEWDSPKAEEIEPVADRARDLFSGL